MGYPKAPEQPQSSRVVLDMSMSRFDEDGREPATICLAAYWSLPGYL